MTVLQLNILLFLAYVKRDTFFHYNMLAKVSIKRVYTAIRNNLKK
ncbi:unknown [Bacteroides sp. CAG:189]|jgi:hypothetical protein|nr:unknown [Bacteroides sp. CAG:189]